MDEFILNYTLERLEELIASNQQDVEDYKAATKVILDDLLSRTSDLELNKQTMNGTISSLIDLVNTLQTDLKQVNQELNKTRLTNIKQEIVVRTLHNLQFFDAHDMHVDTFANGENIDFVKSIRAELLTDLQAIGKTYHSYIKLEQPSNLHRFLISGNGASDEAIIQSFEIDKSQVIDKVSFYIEAHDTRSWRDVRVRLFDTLGGTPISTTVVPADDILNGWLDVKVGQVKLTAFKQYYVEIWTDDPYGYRIGVDFADMYLPGTSYAVLGGVHSDNNYDIGFKIWCFPADDENDATIYTKVRTLSSIPRTIIFEKEDIIIDGSINYHVSRDNGVSWKILQPGIETNLDDLPEGNQLIIRASIMGGSYINAWGYVLKRGETT